MIQSVSLWRFSQPYSHKPLAHRGESQTREGLLLNWQTKDSRRIWSEVSPLPGFSDQSLESCEHQLKVFFSHQIDVIKHESGSLDEPIKALYPSVRFGLEAGLLQAQPSRLKALSHLSDALISTISNTINNSHDNSNNDSLPVCKLLDHDSPAISTDDTPVIKMKVGRLRIDEDIERINHLLANTTTQQLRLDANRSWTLKQARHFFAGIDSRRIEFIEEPLSLRAEYQLWNESVPFAWDETLREPGTVIEPIKGLAALVVKPMLSGLGTTLQFAEKAEELGLKLVISSAYETSMTLNLLYRLACALPDPQPPGLDTHQAFEYDLLEPIRFPAFQPAKPLFPEKQFTWLATYS